MSLKVQRVKWEVKIHLLAYNILQELIFNIVKYK